MPVGQAWEIVVETEAEFDENERDSQEAYAEYEDATCPHCGQFKAICSNPDGLTGRGYYPQRAVCYVKAAEDAAIRKYARIHKDADEDEAGYLPTDGVAIWASPLDLTPDDDFLMDANDRLLAAVVQKARSDRGEAPQSGDQGD